MEHLKKYAERQGAIPPYMRALGLGDRLPVASEEKYLNAWQEMGFPPETVALAYDKTVLKCHELKWPYCNGILKRWHEAGLHTPEEIERRTSPRRSSRHSRRATLGNMCKEGAGTWHMTDGLLRLAQERYEADRSAREADLAEAREQL